MMYKDNRVFHKILCVVLCFFVGLSGCAVTASKEVSRKSELVKEESWGVVNKVHSIKLTVTNNKPVFSDQKVSCLLVQNRGNAEEVRRTYLETRTVKYSRVRDDISVGGAILTCFLVILFIGASGGGGHLGSPCDGSSKADGELGLKEIAEYYLKLHPGEYEYSSDPKIDVRVSIEDKTKEVVKTEYKIIDQQESPLSRATVTDRVIPSVYYSERRTTDPSGKCEIPLYRLLLKSVKQHGIKDVTIQLKTVYKGHAHTENILIPKKVVKEIAESAHNK
jgi:hypothetical protein